MRCTQAIRARIASADDHHALAGSKNLVGHHIARAEAVLLREKLHGEMDALQLAGPER